MYATANLYDRYRNDVVASASPIDLIIMLYDGCIKQVKLAALHMEEKDIQGTNTALQKAQDIIDELMRSLDMSIELSENLLKLYEFCYNELVEANIKKDMERTKPVLHILSELRDAWKEVKRMVGKTYIEGE